MLFTLLSFVTMISSSISAYANENQQKELLNIVKPFMPFNATLISPENPNSTKSIQLYDFDHDGQDEIIFTFEIKAKEQPSPSQFGSIILKKENAVWRKIWDSKFQGVELNFSSLADITGDGTKEYLFGVTIGAAMGSELEVFQWADNSFKMIADVPYHKFDLLNGNGKVGIAVWQMYIGDSYLVDVLKWNSEKLVYNEELYAKYYPEIEKFYKAKISALDAWYYWYSLADAQIKANQFDKASKSIQKGISLAEKIPMQEVIQDFKELNEKLENKRN